MEFELPSRETEAKVLSVDEHSIMRIKSLIAQTVDKVNSFINDFNEAHLGTPIQFSDKYTHALFQDRLQDVAGLDFGEYIERSPKFLQIQLNQLYKEFISTLYDRSHSVYRNWGHTVHKFYESVLRGDLEVLLKISPDGKLFLTEELDNVLKERFTVYSSDINPALLEKMEMFIQLENEIKSLVGKYSFKNVMGTQCPIEFNIDFHEFNPGKLVAHIKKHQIDTYTIKED